MKNTVLALLWLCVLTFSCSTIRPTAEQLANPDCGKYPSDYEQIITAYLKEHRYDPYSETIVDLQITEPRGCWHHAGGAAPVTFGYCFMVSLNPKNKMGGYTGLKHYFAFIRDDSVRTFVDDEGSYEKANLVNCTAARKQ
ncbi:MAG: hypothetical protein ACM3ON_04780 [Chloroflexota bacterium]